MKILLFAIFTLICSTSLANPSSVSGIQLLTLIAQLRGLPPSTLLEQVIAHPSQANILDTAKQMRLPRCVIKELAWLGSRLLSEQQLAILSAQIRTNHCFSSRETEYIKQIEMVRLNTLKDVAQFITAVNPNSLISSSLEKIAPDNSIEQSH